MTWSGFKPAEAPELVRGAGGQLVPAPALEALEVDAVAQEAVQLDRGDDPRHVAVAEPELVGRRSQADGRRARSKTITAFSDEK